MDTILEGKIQEKVIKYLKSNRIYHFRFQAQSNLNGLPDIMCLYKGILIGIELKKDNGVPTKLQLRKIKTLEENGGMGIIARSVEEVDNLFKSIDEIMYANEK